MQQSAEPVWYIVGYLRTVPGERTFVFPVVQNADVVTGRAYYALNGTKLEFWQPDGQEELIRIAPVGLTGILELQDALPLYGYEFDVGRTWFGDASLLSKMLIDFACHATDLTDRARREISQFVDRVVMRREFVAKLPLLVETQATISESRRGIQIDEFDSGTSIVVVGIGSGGINAVEHMISEGVSAVEFISVSTDRASLGRTRASKVIQLGQSGLGAGGNPVTGQAAAEESIAAIKAAISGANLLFITAGMGGGTGTGAAPVIAQAAKELGILTVGLVTLPFEFEGTRRGKTADAGVAELAAIVDSLIVVTNDRLLDVLGDDVTQDQAFAYANEMLKNAVSGISDIIHIPGLVNVDFEDVKTVMSEPGKAAMGTAIASGPDRATKAADAAVAGPMLEGTDLSDAKSVLVLIAASRSTFRLSESKLAMNTIRRYASGEAHVIFGTAYDESLGDQMRVTVIATGLSQSRRTQAPLVVLQTTPALRGMPMMHIPMPQVMANAPTMGAAHAQAGMGAPAMPMSPDYGHLGTPSVWRHRQHAAAKVEALSSHGMDEIEIPAFLRKNAE